MKTSANSDFKDVPVSFWAHDAIDYLTSLDVIKGYPEQDGTSTFKPDSQVTRAQAAIMMVKAIDPNDKGTQVGKASFSDVPLDHWASSFIERAYELGIFKGRENGKFSPQDPITRAQMSAVIANVFSLDPNIVVAHSFNDVPSSHWAYESISLLYSNGIVIGNSQGYEPQKVTNRAQFSVFLTNTLHASKITEAAIAKGTVNANSLNVRELPSTSAKVVTNLQNNQSVDIYGELNNWYIIKHNDKRAYVSANFITNVQVIGEEGTDEEKVIEEVKEEPTPIENPISPPEADLIIGKGL